VSRLTVIGHIGLTLLIAWAGAIVFAWAKLPLPYMLGPMTVTMLISLFTPFRMLESKMLDQPGRAVIGLAIGAAFVPEIAGHLLAFTPSLLLLVGFLTLCTYLAFVAQRRWLGIDSTTSFFAALPGGAASMTLISQSMGANAPIVALLHAVRLFVLVSLVPNMVLWIDPQASLHAPPARPMTVYDLAVWGDYAILVVAAIAATWVGGRMRLPSPSLLGAMIFSALLYSTDIVHAPLPDAVVNFAQLLCGIQLGNGFRREDRGRVVRMGGFNVVIMGVLVGLSALIAVAMHEATGIPYSLVLLAFTPGGLTEMSVMAYVMGLPVEFVAVHHVTRVLLVPIVAPAMFKFVVARRKPAEAG
jgi:hypothetical protein